MIVTVVLCLCGVASAQPSTIAWRPPTGCTNGQSISYNSSTNRWECAAVPFATAGAGLTASGSTVNVIATTGGGLVVAADSVGMLTSCSSGEILKWSGSAWACATDDTIGGGAVTGTGTTNTLPKWTSSSVQGDSLLTDNATTLAYNTNKFTVVAASGNTTVAGTFAATGAITDGGNRVFSVAGSGLSSSAATVSLNMTGASCSAGQYMSALTATGAGTCTAEVGDISSVVAGAGLYDGGTSGTVTVSVGAGTGITVAADSISVDTSVIAEVADISGTTNTVAKFTAANTVGNSTITDDGSSVVTTISTFVGLNTGTDAKVFNVGRRADLSTNAQNGYEIQAYSDGNNYIDSKAWSGGLTYFRAGAGAESGAARIWLTLTNGTGVAAFGSGGVTMAGTLNVTGLITATAGFAAAAASTITVPNASITLTLTGGSATSNNTQLRFNGQKDGALWAVGTDIVAGSGATTLDFYSISSGLMASISTSGLFTSTGGGTTGNNWTTTGSGDLVSGDDLTVADDASVSDTLAVGGSAPGGKFSVISSDAGTLAGLNNWANYSVFGPNAGSNTGAALGVGYSTTGAESIIASIQPGTAWKPLTIGAGGINLRAANGANGCTINTSSVLDCAGSMTENGTAVLSGAITSNTIPKGSSNNLADSGITDDGATLTSTSAATILGSNNSGASAAIGYNIGSTTNAQPGHRAELFGGDVYHSSHVNTSGSEFFRIGAGTSNGATNLWLTVNGTTGATNFSAAGTFATTLAVNGNATLGDNVADSHTINGHVTNYTTAGASFAAGSYNHILSDTTSMAQGVGGGLRFEGNYTGTTGTVAALIKAAKTNATDGNYSFDLVFGTRANGVGDVAERMRIADTGATTIAMGTPTVAAAAPAGTILTLNQADATANYLTFRGTIHKGINFNNNSASQDGFLLYDAVSRSLTFGAGASTRMQIDSNGSIYFGDTTNTAVANNVDTVTLANTGTGQTTDADLIDASHSGTYNIDSADHTVVGLRSTMTSTMVSTTSNKRLYSYAVKASSTSTASYGAANYGVYTEASAAATAGCSFNCSSTSGPSQATGIYASASGADILYSGYFDNGNFHVGGNADFGGTLDVTGALNGYKQVTQSADQDVTNLGLTDSNTFLITTAAGKIYAIDAFIIAGGSNATGDYIFDFAVAAGTMDCTGTEQSVTTADAIQNTTVIATAAADTADTSVGTRADASLPIAIRITLACKVSNATTLKYRFGNAAASAGRISRTMAGSYIQWKQLN